MSMTLDATILVIDDNAMMLHLATKVLHAANYDVLSASSGRDGIAIFESETPDLVLCDLQMPDMDGFAVVQVIRELAPLTPFIFLTAHGDEKLRRRGIELGADDFLLKPIHRKTLLAAIQGQLAKNAKQRSAISNEHEALAIAQRRLMTLIAHELRTPLSSIKLAHEILTKHRGKLSEDKTEKFLHTIGTGTRRLTHIIEQMVLITQLEMQILTHDIIQTEGLHINIHELLSDALPQARTFIPEAEGKKRVSTDSIQNLLVLCDINSLRYALAELISNALRYSHEEVSISVWESNSFCQIRIWDDGDGIAPEDITEAFKPFSQLEREQREQQGMGMGLSLARQILEVHGGTIEIHAGQGISGTEVLVALPLASNTYDYYI